jgi:hypothetical protein
MVATPYRSPRLERLARAAAPAPARADERCELCAAPIAPAHPHLLDLERGDVRCACGACAILFDRREAAGGQLRRIPDRRVRLTNVEGDELAWATFGIPVDLAFFVADDNGAIEAFYPGPAGTTRASVDADAWSDLAASNSLIATMQPRVEALLVRQHGPGRSHFVVPVDDCFHLVGLMRSQWRGFSGGRDVWRAIDEFFTTLEGRAKEVHGGAAGR